MVVLRGSNALNNDDVLVSVEKIKVLSFGWGLLDVVVLVFISSFGLLMNFNLWGFED